MSDDDDEFPSFEYAGKDEFGQVETFTRSSVETRPPKRIAARPVKCYLRGLRSHHFLKLNCPRELEMDDSGEENNNNYNGSSNGGEWSNAIKKSSSTSANENGVVVEKPPNNQKLTLFDLEIMKDRSRRRERLSSRGFYSIGTDESESSDVLDDDADDGGGADRVRDENNNDADNNNTYDNNTDDNDEDEISDHGSLSTISSIDETDFALLSSDEKRRRAVKEKRKEERRRIAGREKEKDEANYEKIIRLAEALKPGSGGGSSRRWGPSRSGENAVKGGLKGGEGVVDGGKGEAEGLAASGDVSARCEGRNHEKVGGNEGRDEATSARRLELLLPPPLQFSSPSPDSRSAFPFQSSPSPANSSLLRSVALPSPLCPSGSDSSPGPSFGPSPAVDTDVEVLRMPQKFSRSLVIDDAPTSPKIEEMSVPFPHPGLRGVEEETPMSLFRATMAADRLPDGSRGNDDDDDDGVLGAMAPPLARPASSPHSRPDGEPISFPPAAPHASATAPKHPAFPEGFEKKRARLHRPDEKVLDEGKFRKFEEHQRVEKTRVPTGNTVKIGNLPKCMNLIQLKDLLDFVGRNGIVKMKLEKDGGFSTAHVKFRSEDLAITALSFLDGCVLKTTDQPLSCFLT